MSKPLEFVGDFPIGGKHRDLFNEQQWRSIREGLHLSGREFQIVQCVFDGEQESVIARELSISAHTVHTHLERLYHKLSVRNRAELLLRIFAAYSSLERGDRPGEAAGEADR